ncbi:MAG: flagellar hook-length control protein FliK [Burkholderiales bacterium]
MINFQALNVLLDTLRKVDPRPPPVARVLALRPMLRAAGDGSTAANDLHAPVPAAIARTAARDFPLAPDPSQGGRLRDAAGNARAAAQVLLSAGGAELERALRGSTGRLPVAPTVRGSAPLTEVPPPSPLPPDAGADDRTAVARSVLGLAYALRDAVTQSGLFYESHLARWVADDFPQASLDREPQAATLPPATDAPGDVAARTPVDARMSVATALAASAADPAGDRTSSAAAARGDAPLLRQQLDVLDTRQFAWVGELWPGQRTAIRFEEDGNYPANRDPSPAAKPQMRAHIILELPTLGTVGAEIAIVEGSVHLQITTDGPAATQTLHAARAELAEALAARALPAAEIAVFDEL